MTNEQAQKYWEQVLSDYQSSGLSGMAFCKQQNIAYHRFTYWRSKLRPSEPVKVDRSSGFSRVMVTDPNRETAELSISLPSGVSITGLHSDNIDLLGPILRQL